VFPSVSAHSIQGWNPVTFQALLVVALSSQNFFFALLLPSLLSKDSQEFLQLKVDGNPRGKFSVWQSDYITKHSSEESSYIRRASMSKEKERNGK
jgi:hypothetical protein